MQYSNPELLEKHSEQQAKLKNIPTCVLFEEIKTRTGIQTIDVDYDKQANIELIDVYGQSTKVNVDINKGPFAILVVYD